MGWLNSDYSLVSLASKCHTPEVAHYTLKEGLERRNMACVEYENTLRKRTAERAVLQRKIARCEDELERAVLECELDEIGQHETIEAQDYAFAKHEIEAARCLMERLDPLCMRLSSGEVDYQGAQCEERALVILERAHDAFMLGSRPNAETIEEIRRHPWGDAIWQQVQAFAVLGGKLDLSTYHRSALKVLPTERGSVYIQRLLPETRANLLPKEIP